MRKKLRVVTIDVGTTKVCCTIAEADARGDIEIIGMGVCPNRGIRKGTVIDIEEATQAIRSAVGEAESQVGTTVQRCFVNLSGDFLSTMSSRGSVAISGSSRVIQETDVQRVTDNARMVGIPEDHRMLHVIPKGFSVDGLAGIKNPVGLSGLLLQVDTHIITGATTHLQNIQTCLERADLEPEESSGMVVSSVATSLGVLRDEEKELGVALVDIGGGTTDLAVFKDGLLRHTDVLSVGGGHISYDVTTALRILPEEAERLVVEEGLAWKVECASSDFSEDDDPSATAIPEREIEAMSLSAAQPQLVKVGDLAEIIEMRLMDIFDWLEAKIKHLTEQGSRPASIVLTGGVAQMHGIAWVAEKRLNFPVRVARPEAIQGLPSHLRNPAYSAVVGLLVYGLGVLKGKTPETRTSQVNKVFQNFITWLREYVF